MMIHCFSLLSLVFTLFWIRRCVFMLFLCCFFLLNLFFTMFWIKNHSTVWRVFCASPEPNFFSYKNVRVGCNRRVFRKMQLKAFTSFGRNGRLLRINPSRTGQNCDVKVSCKELQWENFLGITPPPRPKLQCRSGLQWLQREENTIRVLKNMGAKIM